ncbi:hypothetical protein C8R44DRAFT_955846 [Mycena epipterygia]|nr:hypothetical protein C8R44DRAFT_955846 [Mycena epipterygia]
MMSHMGRILTLELHLLQWGSSTRNTQIEQLWVEVGTARWWRAFFTQLRRLHHLDRKNPGHLWLLHQLFLPSINNDCQEFQEDPADMRFLGQTTEGVYATDPLEGIHLDVINHYYGVEGGKTGAGHEDEEEDPEGDDSEPEVDPQEELKNQIQADQAQNIRHAPVKVARHHSPFEEEANEATFVELLELLLRHPNTLPEDYGILPEEWDEDSYGEIEMICTGTNGKELVVVLPWEEWFPRAVQ